MKILRFDRSCRRVASVVLSAIIVATLAPLPAQVAQAADTIQTLATSYQPTISETIDASGFKHPGMGFTKETLDNVRTQVRAQKEPWNTYFNNMLLSGAASKTPPIRNVDGADPSKPRTYGLYSQGVQGFFIQDANVAHTQAILYYVTGDETYRANAMRIIRLYEQMDPAQYVHYTDAHIHTGIPLSRMTAAAEILRYTSTQNPALAWTDDDTVKFSTNLVIPVMQTFNSCNCRFMNQHLYTTIGKMTGAIFTGNQDEYKQAVEWFTVNKDALDQGQNGSIKRLFRMVTHNDLTGEAVTPAVQHVEMGRDQAHGAGDLTNAEILARLMMSQGTKVDPVEGTVSTAPNAVGPYEFLDDRILAAAELFASYMIGHEIPWVPTASHTDAQGNPTISYRWVSGSYRGRTSQNIWELFYYYQYVRGIDMAQRAPNFTKFFAKRMSYNWDGVDGGGDFWFFIPKEAEAEGSRYLITAVTDPYREVEDRFTALGGSVTATQDGDASYLRVMATAEGSKFAVFGYGYGATHYGLRIRTNGIASMDIYGKPYTLPDTQGQWRYLIIPGNVDDFLPFTITGNGTTVDIDHIHVKSSTLLTPPAFKAGNADLSINTYTGATLATTADFSATDAAATDVLTYQAINLPQGASLDSGTGAFSWKPIQAGTYDFFVQVSDGTSIAVKRVSIVVDPDRQAMIARQTAAYKPDTLYVASTLATYNSAYADMMNTVGTSSDPDYFQKLDTLKSAVAGLEEMNPLLSDGSLNFTKMFVASDFGKDVANLVDNFSWSATPYSTGLVLTMDLGASFKIAANRFRVQGVVSFPERMGGVAIFGSDDKENWTRLTPGLTAIVDEIQDAPVQEDLKNKRFRFFKLHMLEPFTPVYQPVPLIQPSELRIFGSRFATINKLTTISLGSDQAIKGRIIPGQTVKLSFKSTEAINNVSATIQGQPATVSTLDNLNWTATIVTNATTALGPVKFLLNYQTAAGESAEPAFFTTDNSSLFIADNANLIGNVLDLTTVTDSANRNVADARATAALLFDSNISSGTDYRLNGSGSGGWVSFDFRNGSTATLSRVDVLGRPGQGGRMNGAVVQGSNDYASWTNISTFARGTEDWQTLAIATPTPYRYIRMFNANAWFGNMSELRLYGVVESSNKIASASISSAQALRNRIVAGNTVKLSFTAKEAINNVSATIHGVSATVSTTDNINFTATATVPQGLAAGAVKLEVSYKTQAGKDGFPLTATTDGSALNLADESDLIRNISTVATLIDSTMNRSPALTKTIVDSLFDSNISTASDFRIGGSNSGIGSYIIFDFKTGNQVKLSSVELLARQDQTLRAKGIVFQGSNDNASWTTIAGAGVQTQDWQTFAVSSAVPYRYIRIYNAANWVGNMAEVRLHGSLQGADTTAPVTTATAPQGTATGDATVSFTAVDNAGGAGVAATYYKVNGGAQQTGTSVVLSTSGAHTVSYWSTDWAGNIEQAQSMTVKVDKFDDVTSAASITRSGLTMNRFTSKYSGTVTITNTSGQTLASPLQLRLLALTAGVTLDNPSGMQDGMPYITLPGALAPGQSVTVTTTFSNPSKASIGYTAKLVSVK